MKAVMYGAGNIGRGFIGQLFHQSGYEVSFLDVNKDVINALNEKHEYPVKILYGDRSKEIRITNVCGVDSSVQENVDKAICEADVMATAVGVNILKFIAKPIAQALKTRWESGNLKPLNIIICENLIGADAYLKGLIAENMNDAEKEKLDTLTGFVEASIGRMVPVQTPEMQDGNILRVCVESYAALPLDSAAVVGERPHIEGAVWFTPFEYYIQRKLYIHNMGHALTAYLGRIRGYEYIWQAIGDADIQKKVIKAMIQSALALSKRHGVDFEQIEEHVFDLVNRFGNRQLGDTVARVGNDLRRKLSKNDRLVGAYNMCAEQGVGNDAIMLGIAAALRFEDGDTEAILREVSGLSNDDIEKITALSETL